MGEETGRHEPPNFRGIQVWEDFQGLTRLHGDLRSFNDFVRSLDEMVDTIALQPDDPGTLMAAVKAIERVVDERARRQPRHPETSAIAMDLKETRVEALRQPQLTRPFSLGVSTWHSPVKSRQAPIGAKIRLAGWNHL